MFHNQQPYTHPRHQQQQLQQHNQRQGGGQFKDNKNKNVECWNFHERGHFSTSCTKPKKAGEHLGPHKAPPRDSTSGARPAAKVNAHRACINHIEVVAAEESPDVILGMFLAESHSALMLFDSSASHSLSTNVLAIAYDLPRSKLSAPMLVQAPGSNLKSDTIC
jgi:hypothetical protein